MSAVEKGMRKTEICKLYNISKDALYDWIALYKRQGNLEPITGYQNGHSHGIKDLAEFEEYVKNNADLTQEEMANYYGVGSSTISRNLQKIGFTRKKRAKRTPKETKIKDENL